MQAQSEVAPDRRAGDPDRQDRVAIARRVSIARRLAITSVLRNARASRKTACHCGQVALTLTHAYR